MCAPPFPQTHTLSTTLAAVGVAAVAQVDLSREADNLRRFNENFRRARAVRSTAFCACSACCALLLLCCCLRHILCPMSLHTHRNAPSRAMPCGHEAMARYMPLPRVPHVPGVISTATVPAGE